MSDTTPQSVSNGCRKYVKSRIKFNTFNTFNNVETKVKQVNVSILKPNAGCLLTQSADVELQNRVFSEEIWLASTDSPDNWKDISIADAEALKQQQEQLSNSQPTEEDRGEVTTM